LFNQKETTTIVIANEVKQSQDCRNLKIAAISKLPQSQNCRNLSIAPICYCVKEVLKRRKTIPKNIGLTA
jgi:hypothetical protein